MIEVIKIQCVNDVDMDVLNTMFIIEIMKCISARNKLEGVTRAWSIYNKHKVNMLTRYGERGYTYILPIHD